MQITNTYSLFPLRTLTVLSFQSSKPIPIMTEKEKLALFPDSIATADLWGIGTLGKMIRDHIFGTVLSSESSGMRGLSPSVVLKQRKKKLLSASLPKITGTLNSFKARMSHWYAKAGDRNKILKKITSSSRENVNISRITRGYLEREDWCSITTLTVSWEERINAYSRANLASHFTFATVSEWL